jgi:beta-glucosidase
VPAALLSSGANPGAKASYFHVNIATVSNEKWDALPLATRVEAGIDLSAQPLPTEADNVSPLTIRWETTLTPAESGDYDLGIETDSFFRLSLDGKSITNADYPHGIETKTGRVHLEKGKPYQVLVEYCRTTKTAPHLRLVWARVDRHPDPSVVAAASAADVVVAVVGITSELEGEEMQVHEEGFNGGDRTSLDLPRPEQDLLELLATAHKPLVVVLTNGSALGVNWAKEHANAILDAWYPGEEGGAAVAETLSGRNNPAGRLPVTFYKDVNQLPPFEDYAMKGRTYRYFEGTPLYPFGYGLSYTSFTYSGLTGPSTPLQAGTPVPFEVTVTNTGRSAGDEVVQLYLEFPKVPGAPLRALRGFQRVHLEAGSSQKVHFDLQPRDLSMVTEAGEPIVAEGQYAVSIGGGQPKTGAQVLTQTFSIAGKLTLPE